MADADMELRGDATFATARLLPGTWTVEVRDAASSTNASDLLSARGCFRAQGQQGSVSVTDELHLWFDPLGQLQGQQTAGGAPPEPR